MQLPTDSTFLIVGAIVFFAGLVAVLMTRSNGPRRSEGSKLKLLRKVPFLAELNDEQLIKVGRLVKELRVPEDSYVIREFRSGEAMFILVSGQVHILKKGAVDETLIQMKGAGEVLGEMALLTGGRRVASVKSVTPCLLLQIDSDDFEEFLEAQPEIAKAVWEACEIHSINLLAADFEKIRSLALEERKAWIATRESRFVVAEEKVNILEPCFLALVAGLYEYQGKKIFPPALIPISGGEQIKVLENGRISMLKTFQMNPTTRITAKGA